MKKLYCLIFLLLMPSVYGMQKKSKPHKKFNIHNVQNAKNNKNPKNKIKYNRWVEEKFSKKLDKRDFMQRFVQDTNVCALSFLMVLPLTPGIVLLECARTHGTAMGCCCLFNWCV